MTTYLKKAMELGEQFDEININQIPRDKNSHTDVLANLGSAVHVIESKNIPIIYLKWLAVCKQEHEVTCNLSIEVTWMTPIFDYLQNNILPKDKSGAWKIKTIST